MANGNGIPKWIANLLVIMLWGALSGVILFLGNTVKANDNKSTKEHTEIRKEVKESLTHFDG